MTRSWTYVSGITCRFVSTRTTFHIYIKSSHDFLGLCCSYGSCSVAFVCVGLWAERHFNRGQTKGNQFSGLKCIKGHRPEREDWTRLSPSDHRDRWLLQSVHPGSLNWNLDWDPTDVDQWMKTTWGRAETPPHTVIWVLFWGFLSLHSFTGSCLTSYECVSNTRTLQNRL